MNKGMNNIGWKRQMRSRASNAREEERKYKEQKGGKSAYERIARYLETPEERNRPTDQISEIVDRRDENIVQKWARDVANGATKFMNDFLDMSVRNAQYKVAEQSFYQQDLEKVQRYIDLVSQKKDLENRLSSQDQLTTDEINNIVDKLQAIDEEKNNLDHHFLTDGKNSDAIFDLMYDTKNNSFIDNLRSVYNYVKGPDGNLKKSINQILRFATPEGLAVMLLSGAMQGGMTAAKSLRDIYRGITKDELQPTVGAIERVSKLSEDALNPFAELLGAAIRGTSAVANMSPTVRGVIHGVNGLYKLAVQTDNNFLDTFDDIQKRAILNSDQNSQLVRNTYRGEQVRDDEVKDAMLKSKLRQQELMDDFLFEKEAAKAGKVTFFGNTMWSYDPIVDQDWLLKDEQFGDNLSDLFTMPTHVLASTASTAQMFKYQIPNLGLEALTSFVLKKYGTGALLGGPAGVVFKGAMTTANIASGIASATASREKETADEAIGAYEERVIQDAKRNGADYKTVQSAVDSFLQENYPQLMSYSADERLKFGITLGVKTGDLVWDQTLVSARQGLQKLINANNSLALKDYMETLPFLPYTGSLFKDAVKLQVFTDVARMRYAKEGKTPSLKTLQRLYRTSGTQKELQRSFINPDGVIQHHIDKAASLFLRKDSKALNKIGLWSRDIAKYGINRIPYAVGSSITESIEEGQQELLKNRYKRGDYDDYSKPYNMFDLIEGLSTLTLANGAIGDYFGINYGDIDNSNQNVRKVMNIGFASSMLFSNARHMLTNVPVLDANNANLLSLWKDMRTSNAVAKLVADDYERAQDYQHAGIFYEMIKRGATANGISNRLLLLLGSDNNTNVTQEMVDASKELAENVELMYHQDFLADIMKDLGYKKHGAEHKQAVLEGAVAISNVQKGQLLTQSQGKNINNKEMDVRWLLNNLLKGIYNDEQKKLLFDANPLLKRLYDNFDKIYSTYLENANRKNNAVRLTAAAILKKAVADNLNPTSDKNFANNAIQQLVKLGLSETRAREELDKAIANKEKRSDIANRIANEVSPVEKKNKAFENLANKYFAYIHEYASDRALELSKRDNELLTHTRRNTGLDINTNKLRGVVSRLQEIKEDFTKRHRDANFDPNREGSAFRKDSEYEWILNGDEEFDAYVDDLMSWYINGALIQPMRAVAAPYMYGIVNSSRLKKAITNNKDKFDLDSFIDREDELNVRNRNKYSKLSKENKQKVDEAISEYLNVHGDILTLRDELEKYGISETEADVIANVAARPAIDGLQAVHDFFTTSPKQRKEHIKTSKQLNRESIKEFIKNRLGESESRSRITRRQIIDDAMTNAGVEHTDQDVEEFAQDQEAALNQDLAERRAGIDEPDRTRSDAELAARRKYYHETAFQQKVELNRKKQEEERRKQANQTDVEEEPPTSDSQDGEESPTPSVDSSTATPTAVNPPDDDIEDEYDDIDSSEDDIEGDEFKDEDIEEPTNIEEEYFGEDEDLYEDTYEEEIALDEVLSYTSDDVPRWINIEDEYLLDIDDEDNITYDGKILPQDQAQYLKTLLFLLDGVDRQWLDQNSIPNGQMNDVQAMRNVSQEYIGNWLANTFFYAVDEQRTQLVADKDADGNIIANQFNGVKLPKEIGTADELSIRLLLDNWLYDLYNKGKVYYIVTLDKGIKSVKKGTDKKDAYTISLVIEDEDKCFLTFLRDLGQTLYVDEKTGEKKSRNSELWWRNWLVTKNVNTQLINQELGGKLSDDHDKRAGLIIDFIEQKTREYLKDVYVHKYGNDVGFEAYMSGKNQVHNDEFSVNNRSAFINAARRVIQDRYAINHESILSTNEADAQINKLRALRNEIIKLYSNETDEIPTEIRTDVIPQRLLQSNGKIDTQKNRAGMPVYRTLVSDDVSIEEVENAFQSDELVIGYGKGAAAYGNKFAVQNIKAQPSTNDGIFHGRGLSGKLYMLIKGLTRDAERVPVMLAEEKFDTQTRVRNGVRETRYVSASGPIMVLDVVNGVVQNTSAVDADGYTYMPSAAEVIFYMLCKRGQFASVGQTGQRSIVDFIVNNGERTLFESRSEWAKRAKRNASLFNTLTSKQLAWFVDDTGKAGLSIGLPEIDSDTGQRVYKLYRFSEDELFAPEGTTDQEILDRCRTNRQRCVMAIAQQMHWNTDLPTLNDFFNGQKLGFNQLKSDMDLQTKSRDEFSSEEEYLQQKYSILGCPELSFGLKDILSTDPGFRNISWLIKNGKIKTDASPYIFKDPYVFGIGAKKSTTVSEDPAVGIDNDDTPIEIPKVEFSDDIKFFSEDISDLFDKSYIATNEQQRKSLIDEWNKRYSKTNKYKILDRIAVVRNAIYETDWDEEYADEHKLNDFVNSLTKSVISSWKTNHKDYNVSDDINVQIDEDDLMYLDKEIVPIVVQFDTADDKTVLVTVTKQDFTENKSLNSSTFLSGVYRDMSDRTGIPGKLDENKARKWLFLKLGISGYNVYVQNGAINGANGRLAYGATSLATDVITKNIIAVFALSKQEGGRGVEYHESWHYVNLLLHDEQYRQAVYDEYAKYNKAAQNATDEEIEEMLADDFMQYMLAREDKSIVGRVKRFFQNIVDFINLVTNRKQYRKIYDNINSGKYAFSKMNDLSVIDFQNKYGGYVYQDSNSQLNQLSGYLYSDIYEAVDSVINQILLDNRAYGADKIKKLFNNKDYFDTLFKPTIDNMIGSAVKQRILALYVQLLEDLKLNPDLIKAHLAQKFSTLGFNIKFKSQVASDIEEKENNPDNVWDKLDISTSRKDNASSKIKMFFSTIPMTELIVDNKGNTMFVDVKTKFGTTKLFDYDTVWGSVVGRLHDVSSYEELRDRIKQLSERHRVFNSLEKRMQLLDNHNDSELKSQLFGICNSHVNHVQTINVSNPFEREWEEEFDYSTYDDEQQGTGSFTNEVLDVTKEWALSDDGAYNPGFTLPRNWSQSLASTSFVHYDQSTKRTSIAEDFIYTKSKGKVGIYNMMLSIIKQVEHSNKLIKDVLGSDINTMNDVYRKNAAQIQGKFINLCNVLCIPIDNSVLYHMFSGSQFANNTAISQALRYYKFIVSLTEDTTRGSVRDVVSKIKDAFDEGSESVRIEGKDKALDEIYNNLSLGSQIARFAINYSQVYPKLGEISTRSANGDKIYPVNLNNYVSDKINNANKNPIQFADDIVSSPYNHRSIIAQEMRHIVPGNQETELRLNTFVGIRQKGSNNGNDYMEMTPMEDYLIKLFLTENNNLVFPTMADKKTWYSLSIGTSSLATKKKIESNSGFNLSHSVITNHIPNKILFQIGEEMYVSSVGANDKSTGSIRKNNINRFINDPKNKNIVYRAAENYMRSHAEYNYRRFDENTISRFQGYLLDEIDALKHFYSSDRIKQIVSNKSIRIDNYDSDVENGRMLFGGNGGLFRYFYNVEMRNGLNMNHILESLYETEKQILNEAAHDNSAKEGEMVQNVSVRQIPQKYAIVNEDKSVGYDGFELIREYLDNLERRVLSGQYTEAINDWLIDKVDTEMRKLSESSSAINLIETIDGKYYPKGIPTQLMNSYVEKLQDLGLFKDGPMYKVGSTYATESMQSVIYSLIGNHVANSITSVIEVEKVFSGDPAFYSYKYKGGSKEVEYTHKFPKGLATTVKFKTKHLTDPYSDKIKRLGGLLSPGTNLRLDFDQRFKRKNKGNVEDVNEVELDLRTTRKYFSDDAEVNGHAILGTSKYTIVDANDIKCPSTQLLLIKDEIKRQTVIDLIHTGKIKYSGSIQELYNNQAKFDNLYESVKDQKIDNITIEEYVDNDVEISSSPYNKITVADAQVIIRPAMYRKIRIGLGDWTKDDERAYWLLETDDKWMEDPEKAKIVRKFQQYVLKMSYFDNDYSRSPIYNKMAIFPIFKFLRSTDTGEQIYNRMNLAGNEIDMIAFKSAIKVGATKDGLQLIDEDASVDKSTSHLSKLLNQQSNIRIDYSNGEILPNNSNNTVSVRVQDLKNLRLQLNTHAHEDMIRSIGTQMFKIGFSNIFDNLTYGQKLRTGKEIRAHIMKTINALTMLGVQEIQERFYTMDDSGKLVLNDDAVRGYMIEILHNNGLGSIAEDIISSGGVVSSLLSRKVFEQSVSKKINKDVVDIHTLGGTAVQLSCFGYEAFENVISDEYVSYNDGKPLVWHKENGTMEVLLSIKFFKSAVPAAFRTDYKTFRQYLINHDIIKGVKHSIQSFQYAGKEYSDIVEKEGEENKPNPFGIGYRIPTQGMSSTFVFTVADVLPEQVGDLIIVPREFTAQTGSDFDIDKLYLATLSYKDGVLEQQDSDTGELTKGSLSNDLLIDYMDIIADKKNFVQSRGSIDTFTEILQTKLLPILKPSQSDYFNGGVLLLPSFLALRKMEFATGKTGIGPFALNVTNLALTQAARLTIDYSEDNHFGLGNLYDIYGKDGKMISGWLSAMVNAHVDVAKDPYIFALNVNRATYNMCNFLIRTGNGLASFAFIAQPALVLYAQQKNAKGGVYGKSLDLGSDNPYDRDVMSKLKKDYISKIEKLVSKSNNGSLNAKALAVVSNLKEGKTFNLKFMRNEMKTTWEKVISLDENKRSLANLEKNTSESLLDHYLHQLLCLAAFERLDKYAQAMSSMVTASQIDTKKFGNDLTLHRVWMNNYYLLRYESNVSWKIDDSDFTTPLDKEGKIDYAARSAKAMNHYFESLFLDTKLNNAIQLTRDVLKTQLIPATDVFDSIFTTVMLQIYGEMTFVDRSKGTDNPILIGRGWDRVYDKNKPAQIANALDNICRFCALLSFGQYLNDGTVDLTIGKSSLDIMNKMHELYFGENDTPSIFQRGADLINNLNAVHDKESWLRYRGLVTINGKITNALLEYLTPMTASQNHRLGRFLLRDSSFDTGEDVKSALRLAWTELINHPNEEVSNFAKDLVLYAYYSKYDQNTPGSFFDIVPLDYRRQYDDALKTAIQMLNSKDSTIQDKCSQLLGGLSTVEGLMDVMYRNYWYDDDVVKSYNYHDDEFDETKDINIFERKSGETVHGGWHYDEDAGQSFPGMVISDKTDLPYFKLLKGNTTYLYKKVGTISRTSRDITQKNGSTMNVYAATPKAGLRDKNNTQFEFYADRYTDSIFEENMLPKQFAEDILKLKLMQRINLHNNSNTKYRLTLTWDDIPLSRMSTNMSAYMQTSGNSTSFEGKSINATNVMFANVNDVSGQKAASVILNIILDSDAKNNNRRVNSKFQDKALNIQFGKLLTQDDISKIIDIIANDDELVDAKHIVHFVTSAFDNQFHNLDKLDSEVSNLIKQRIEQLKNEHLDNYRQQLVEDKLEESKIKALLDVRALEFEPGQTLYNFAKSLAGMELVGDYINTVIQDLTVSGVNIERATSVASANNTFVSLGISHAANISMSSLRNTIYCSQTMPQLDRKTYSTLIGRLGRLAKADQLLVDQSLRNYKEAATVDVMNEAFDEIQNNDISAMQTDDLQLWADILNEIDEDDERQNEDCSSILGSARVDIDDDFDI